MDESKEELTKEILAKGDEVSFDEDVFKLSEEEEEKIDIIGETNFDYCVTALLNLRNPDHNFVLDEENEMIVIDDMIELEFNPEVWQSQNEKPRGAIADAVGYISTVFIDNLEKFEQE